MLAGFFPTTVSFRGSYRYASSGDLERAITAVQELIDGEDDEIAPSLALKKKECELRVLVETTCARDEYLAYETLVETLASFAIAGEVHGEIDDTITTYNAEAKPVAKAAALVAWIPIVACDSIVDLALGLA
jgi:hypothetical protein